MDWDEFRILYRHKQRELLAATQRARTIEHTSERRPKKSSIRDWLMRFRHAPHKRTEVA
jgi:hypothetical protein